MMKGAGGWRCRHQKVWRKEERRRSERKYSHQNIKIPINALLSEHSTSTHNHTINFEYFQRSQAILSHTIAAKPSSTCHHIVVKPPPSANLKNSQSPDSSFILTLFSLKLKYPRSIPDTPDCCF